MISVNFVKPLSENKFSENFDNRNNARKKYKLTYIKHNKSKSVDLPRTLQEAKRFDHLIQDYADYLDSRSKEIKDA